MRSPRSASDWAWHANPILACRFGKLLILRAVPEWRSQYRSYKKLKRILKRIGDDDDEEWDGTDPGIAIAVVAGVMFFGAKGGKNRDRSGDSILQRMRKNKAAS